MLVSAATFCAQCGAVRFPGDRWISLVADKKKKKKEKEEEKKKREEETWEEKKGGVGGK